MTRELSYTDVYGHHGLWWMYWNYDKAESLGRHTLLNKLGQFGMDASFAPWLVWNILRYTVIIHPLPVGDHSELAFRPGFALKYRTESSIYVLPFEMIDQICSELEDLLDIVCFSVTSRLCWGVGRGHIKAIIERETNQRSWAGDRIMCKGDYLHVVFTEDSFPPEGMLSADERKQFKEHIASGEWSYCSHSSNGPFSWWKKYSSRFAFRDRFSEQEYALLLRLVTLSPDYRASLGSLPPLDTQVLRNLTRREYVRGDAFRKLIDEKPPSSQFFGDLSFGEILTTQIRWSPDPSVPASMAYEGQGEGQMHRRVWAGNRFDVMPVENFDPTDGNAEWKDVSDQVVREIEGLWTS